ncbi:myeloid cell surface antigen CD33-like, partial [Clarias magur]
SGLGRSECREMNIIILVLLFTFTVETKGNNITTTVTSEGVTSNNGSTQGSQFTSNQESSSTSTEELTSSATSTLKPTLTVTSSSTMNANTSYNNDTTVQPTSNFFNYMDLRTILIFMLGVIFSTVIFSVVLCVVSVCIRCRKTDANTDKEGIILEAVKSEHDQSVMQSDEHQADEQAPLQVHSPVSSNTSTLNGGTDEEMKVFGKEQTEGLGVVNELDYASINYSLLQKKDDGDSMPQKVESDYAEIQLKKPSEGEKVETLPDGERPEEPKQDGVDQDLDSEM